jgi:hypothetical protein
VEESLHNKVAEEPKSICRIRIPFSDLTAEDYDPFIGYWIKVYGNRRSEDGSESEGKDVRVLDTCANVNTMSRRRFVAFLYANLDLEYAESPFGGLEVKLAGCHTLHVAGDKVRIETEVSTTMCKTFGHYSERKWG